MTESDQIALTAAFDRWFKGDKSAARMCALLTEAAHTWDDLVDADKPVPPATAARAFRILVLELPSCTFYHENFSFLQPVVTSIWAQWSAANVIESGKMSPEDRAKAFMLRAGLYQLYHMTAVLTGGLDWAEVVGPEIYAMYGEKLGEFDA